jgi:probable addiction module antidote protein
MADIPSQNTPPGTIDTLEALASFLADAFETGDPGHIAAALATAARSKAFPELAAATGLPRDALSSAMTSGELNLDTTLAIMKVIDLHLAPRPGTGLAG